MAKGITVKDCDGYRTPATEPRRRGLTSYRPPWRTANTRNQRYPRGSVAENVFVGGMLVAFLAIEIVGLWVFGQGALYFLLAGFLLVLPIAIYGWLLLWDLNRPGPRRDVTSRALLAGIVLGIRRKGVGELGAAIESRALALLRPLLPSVHTISQLKLGEKVEVISAVRFPAQCESRALSPRSGRGLRNRSRRFAM